jgi:hypothetical protein
MFARIKQLLARRLRAFAMTATFVAAIAGGVVVADVVIAPGPAQAVIGRPFTPMSYAGVGRRSARRTSRRVSRRHAYYGGYGYGGYATAPSCPYVNGVYTCGSTSYAPAYDGTTVVYVED